MQVVISIGSNSLHRQEAVNEALNWISLILGSSHNSGVYDTPAEGNGSKIYSNAVVCGEWLEDIETLEKTCKEYEKSHGRDEKTRQEKIVPVDLDIVIADNNILRPSDFKKTYFSTGYEKLLK